MLTVFVFQVDLTLPLCTTLEVHLQVENKLWVFKLKHVLIAGDNLNVIVFS